MRFTSLVLAGCTALVAAPELRAQYPLAPSPTLDVSSMSPEVKLGGYIAVRSTHRNDSTTTIVNRARVTVTARPHERVGLRVQGDLAARGRAADDSSVAAFALTDAYVTLVPPDKPLWAQFGPSLTVGQFRVPYALEYLTPFSSLRTVDRSLPVDSISPRRDIGAMAEIHLTPLVRLAGALVNGGGANNTRNTDDRQLAAGRLSLIVPIPIAPFAIAGKWAGEGGDHRWGYDARFLPGKAVIEGEALQRNRFVNGLREVSSGGYALAAYTILPWLQPVVKWEKLEVRGPITRTRRQLVYGANLMSADDRVRLQLNWITRQERPVEGPNNELVAQFIANF